VSSANPRRKVLGRSVRHVGLSQQDPAMHVWAVAQQLVPQVVPLQTQLPPASQVKPDEHPGPHVPPQPSSPHSRPVQSGTQVHVPRMHVSRAAQAWPHDLQFSRLDCRSTQAPEQFVRGPQEDVQTDSLHTSPAAQRRPHVPQFPGSLVKSAQPPGHRSRPGGQPVSAPSPSPSSASASAMTSATHTSSVEES
jgi:hypothetical protein